MVLALVLLAVSLGQVPFEPFRPSKPAPPPAIAKPDAKPEVKPVTPPAVVVWQSTVAIWSRPAAELATVPLTTEVEHDSEVARDEAVTVVVTLQGCQLDASGACRATADLVTHKPDGTVHSETKNVALTGGRGTARLALTPTDVTGVYTVIATVRDPEARRVARSERLFGVK
jgi:hypothetical protein